MHAAVESTADLPVERVREQLERLRLSPMFEKSDRLMTFLQHIVDALLAGNSRLLTESGIGNAVYGRVREYDARIDSTVRVEARRLRRKLTEYYAGPGRHDPIVIGLPVGSYVPILSTNESVAGQDPTGPDVATESPPIFRKGLGAALAVLPLRALSNEPRDQSFADGLTDELTFVMGRSKGLRVVSRSAVAASMQGTSSLPALASQLTVDAILQGTVRSENGVMRVTIEVANPQGFIVWSDRIDAPDGERMRLQELMATTLLSRARFDSSQMRAMQIGPGPVALEANAKVYRARQLLDQQTPAALREALEIFEQVARSAPDYARGHSGIADCYCDMYRIGLIDQKAAVQAAKPAALRALAIDPQSIEGRCALGTICGWLEWNRYEAEQHYRAALSNGESSRTARSYGVLLTIMERHEEAEHMFWEAREMEPFSAQQDIAESVSRYQSRRFGQLAEAIGGLRASRLPVEALVYAALSRAFSGDAENARKLLDSIDFRVTRHPDLIHARAELEAWLGNTVPAETLLRSALEGASFFARGTLAAAANDADAAVRSLSSAVEHRELSAVWLRMDPRFDKLRGLPQFDALIAHLNQVSADRFPR